MRLLSSSASRKWLLKKVVYTPYIVTQTPLCSTLDFPGKLKEIPKAFGGKSQGDNMAAPGMSDRWVPKSLPLTHPLTLANVSFQARFHEAGEWDGLCPVIGAHKTLGLNSARQLELCKWMVEPTAGTWLCLVWILALQFHPLWMFELNIKDLDCLLALKMVTQNGNQKIYN